MLKTDKPKKLIAISQVQNGIMIYTTWTTIATLINVTIVLTYDVKMSPADAATISYGVLAALLLVWYVICKHAKISMSDLSNPQRCSETMSVFVS